MFCYWFTDLLKLDTADGRPGLAIGCDNVLKKTDANKEGRFSKISE